MIDYETEETIHSIKNIKGTIRFFIIFPYLFYHKFKKLTKLPKISGKVSVNIFYNNANKTISRDSIYLPLYLLSGHYSCEPCVLLQRHILNFIIMNLKTALTQEQWFSKCDLESPQYLNDPFQKAKMLRLLL